MDTRYDFSAEAERALYDDWEARGAFCCQGFSDGLSDGLPDGQESSPKAKTYTIMMPPPNVTGRLHIGHALDNTLQDILVRLRRQQGYDCLWLPGTDHAGIATQLLVSRHLAEQGVALESLSREEFLAHTWRWKEQYGNIILQQLRRLGTSCDWQRARFTMDEGLSRAVRRAFLELHEQGLIYRDERLVNWDPQLRTAISDLEVRQQEQQGKLCLIDYPLLEHSKGGKEGDKEEGSRASITIATMRPETLFGDLAVAVHPDDERYRALVGKRCLVPLAEREVAIIADERVEREQGTGALKITPAHDFLDFEIGKQHGLPLLSIFDDQARLNDKVPAAYRGLSREQARERVLADVAGKGLLREVRDATHSVPHGERSGVALEPRLTKQWFMNMENLAERALDAVEKKNTTLLPQTWVNTWRQWLENIQPWCLSRQLWWGHRIPIWYAPNGEQIAAWDEKEALQKAQEKFGKKVDLKQEEDVLDTWFSSALWPFSTLGWRNGERGETDKDSLLDRYFPTQLLVTGFDILFFWVARMMMMSLCFMNQVPFKIVYLHALIRDAKGRKMSKSLGNVVDPIALMDRYGCDALRFTLASQAVPGRDLRLSEKKIEGNRNFITKLWNAARFLGMQNCRYEQDFKTYEVGGAVHRWILMRLREVTAGVEEDLRDEVCLFHEATSKLYHFLWGVFCDEYLEMIKPVLASEGSEREEARVVSAWVFYGIVRLLHPFVPFVTERIFQESKIFEACQGKLLITSSALRASDITFADWDADEKEVIWILGLIDKIRSLRSDLGLPPQTIVRWFGDVLDKKEKALEKWGAVLRAMAGIEWRRAEGDRGQGRGIGFVYQGVMEPKLFLPEEINLNAIKLRIEKQIVDWNKVWHNANAKLDDQKFKENAPREILLAEQERLGEADTQRDGLYKILADIKDLC